MVWEKLDKTFIESDVVAWTESIWPPNLHRRRRKQKAWGKQKVTAQITAIDGEFIKLTVLKSEITENIVGGELRLHKIGSTFTKKSSTLLCGEPQRLRWSEEDVRETLSKQPNL